MADLTYTGRSGEYLTLHTLLKGDNEFLSKKIPSSLTIVWNPSHKSELEIDGIGVEMLPHSLLFLTDQHESRLKAFEEVRMIKFNRSFYCIIDHDAEVGCKGLLFYGASRVPVLQIPKEEEEKFELLWRMFRIEMESKDNLQFDMLQMMLKRMIILCTRLYKEQTSSTLSEGNHLSVVREFNFLVEQHYKQYHSVNDYAGMLQKSPKTLANYFALYSGKSPLQIIQERVLLESRRLLIYTDRSIKEIAYEVGFEDIQSFSRFFKTKEGISPSEYRTGRGNKVS